MNPEVLSDCDDSQRCAKDKAEIEHKTLRRWVKPFVIYSVLADLIMLGIYIYLFDKFAASLDIYIIVTVVLLEFRILELAVDSILLISVSWDKYPAFICYIWLFYSNFVLILYILYAIWKINALDIYRKGGAALVILARAVCSGQVWRFGVRMRKLENKY